MQLVKKYYGILILIVLLAVAAVLKFSGVFSVGAADVGLDPTSSVADEVAPEITDNPDETPEAVDPALTASASPGVSSSPSASATPIPANSSKPYLVRVYLGSQSVCVYGLNSSGTAYDRLVRTMICSTGTGGATPQGTFKLQGKYRWHSLMGGVYGQYCSRITGSILFHSILYKVNGDPSTLNETTYKKLGRKASHGCIRLLCGDAYWIYSNVASGSTVEIVSGSGPRGSKPALASGSQYRGWDPTDPAANNPYRGYVEPTHTPTHTPAPATPTPTHTVKPTHTPTPVPATPTPTHTHMPVTSPSHSSAPTPSEEV